MNFADRIKVINQLTLVQEDYSGLSGWAQCNCTLQSVRGGQNESPGECSFSERKEQRRDEAEGGQKRAEE